MREPRDTSWLTTSRVRSAWLFLTPMLVVIAMVAAYPLIRTIYLSFTDANLLRLDQAKVIGFENFITKGDDADGAMAPGSIGPKPNSPEAMKQMKEIAAKQQTQPKKGQVPRKYGNPTSTPFSVTVPVEDVVKIALKSTE